jgi:hypothetical protein
MTGPGRVALTRFSIEHHDIHGTSPQQINIEI